MILPLYSLFFSAGAFTLKPDRIGSKPRNDYISATPVVRVLTQSSPGSAVIIGKKGDLYTAITAAHVIGDINQHEENYIQIETGETNKILSKTIPFKDVDFAIIQFRNAKDLRVAILPFTDVELSKATKEWRDAELAGYAVTSGTVQASPLRISKIEIISVLSKSYNGYNLLYNATTNAGQSGGAIFAIPRDVFTYWINPENPDTGFIYEADENHDHAGSAYNETIYNRCMSNSVGWKPPIVPASNEVMDLIKEAKIALEGQTKNFNKIDYCRGIQDEYRFYSNCKQDIHFISASETGVLLAIHGMSEKYVYGGKSGSSLGIIVIEGQIRDYLKANGSRFGLSKPFQFARSVCKTFE